jgi:phosphoglycolate phosphatase-like HAD superfamily hydrolase
VRLVLFDIDGTLLLRASAEHRAALHDAISEVWGVEDPGAAPVEAAGRTDVDIARAICLLAGVPAERFADGVADFRAAATAAYARRCPDDLSPTVSPGMHDVLADLARRGRHLLALLTGNLEPVARLKLERAGLGSFFASGLGAFGSDHEDRAALPAIARRRAAHLAGDGEPWPREATVVVGDTPRDIACARADGVGVVAIATGPFAPDRLGGADAVVRSAPELLAVL